MSGTAESDPLTATAARLRALVPGAPDLYTVEPGEPARGRIAGELIEPAWWPVAEVPIERWCADAREPGRSGNPRGLASVAATSVGGALVHAVLARVTAALVVDARAWDVDALVVHRAPWGHIDRVALRSPLAWVTAQDPALRDPALRDPALRDPALRNPTSADPAPRPLTSEGRVRARAMADGGRGRGGAARVFADEAALLDAVAAAAVATLDPLLRRVRAATRFGLVPLWNAAADAVRLTAANVPLYVGRPPRPALAGALLDALVRHGAPVRGRGVEQPLPGRAERVPVRAACCLAFRTDPPVARPADALCTTCPLLPAPDRARRYAAFLDSLGAPRSLRGS